MISFVEQPSLLVGSTLTAASGWIYAYIANGLTRVQYPDMAVIPDLAESWDVSSDRKTYTFKLRTGVKWHDGAPFSARDVKFTYEMVSHPKHPSAFVLAIVEGASAFKKGEATAIAGIRVIADDRIEFRLTGPSNLFLAINATQRILPQHVLANVAPNDLEKSPFARKPIYTGPFMVEEWRAGESMRFKAVVDHFAGRPKLDELVHRFIPDPATQRAELRSGGLMMANVGPDQLAEFERDPSTFEIRELAGASNWFIYMDRRNPLFSDRRVRMAMSHAIDRAALIRALVGGKGEESYSLASPVSWIYNPDIPKFPYNVDRAKQLLDEAGWRSGADGIRVKDGRRFSFQLDVALIQKAMGDWAIALQPYFKAVGIEVTVNPMENTSWLARTPQQASERPSLSGWVNFNNDPRQDLLTHWRPSFVTNLLTGFSNARVLELFTQAEVAPTRDEEKRIYGEIQKIAEDEATYAYMFREKTVVVSRRELVVPPATTEPQLQSSAAAWYLR